MPMKMKMKKIKNNSRVSITGFSILICAVFLNFACTPRSFEKPNAVPSATVEDQKTQFERDLQTLKTPDLKYIFVFRRKDGGKVDGDDKKYLRTNLPVTNRILISDEEKAVIVGSNYEFPQANLEALRTRFNVEDFSAIDQAK